MGGEAGRVVLDTDVLVDFLKGVPRAVELVRGLREKGAALATTVVNIFELAWGAHRVGRARDVEGLADAMVVLSLTPREAVRAGEEAAYLSSIGLAIDVRDLLIGVIARENGYGVATGNLRHFTKIRGLTVVPYQRG